jgi:hypothetical protein
MRTARTALTALVFAAGLTVAATAQPPAPLVQPALNAAVSVAVGIHGTVGVDYFYSNLAPYGYWVNRPSYGWVWLPRHIRHGWRPYSSGRWAYTDYGWTWVSSEPFGWATYHYGRWNLDPDYGWAWVPGTDWGPSWVSWQQGGGYLGWAPLPPQVGFSAGVGLDFGGFNVATGIDPGWYCFAPERSFLAANVGAYVLPPGQNVTIIRNTTNITNYRVENGRVFNGSVPVDRIQQVTGQPVRQLQLANASDPRVARVNGNQVALFRPAAVVRRANAPDPPHVVPHAVATGRIAQQLVQQRHAQAAQFRLAGNQGANAGARAAQGQAPAARNQQRQAQARTQSPVTGRNQQQAQSRRQSTSGRNQQQALSRHQATPAGRNQQLNQSRRRSTPAGRNQQQAQSRRQYAPGGRPQQHNRQASPPPQRQPQAQARHQATPAGGDRQQALARRQSAPPPQHQSAPPQQHPQQAQRQSPPQQQRQAQSPPPPRPQRQAAPPPPRQARNQAPPQQRRQNQPPPPNGGGPGGNR